MFMCLVSSYMKRRLSVTNLSLKNNLELFQLNAAVIIREKVSIQCKHQEVIYQAQVGNL